MLVLRCKYSKFLFTIHTVQSRVRQHREYQPVMDAAVDCLRLLMFCLRLASFLLRASLTGLVRRRTLDRWRRSTASTKASKRSSVCWRPCSVNKRTQPKPVELTHSGTSIGLKRTWLISEKSGFHAIGSGLFSTLREENWWNLVTIWIKCFIFKFPKHMTCRSWLFLL